MKPTPWGWIAAAVFFALFVYCRADYQQAQEKLKQSVIQIADLKSQNTTVARSKAIWQFQGLHQVGVCRASDLTGCPAQILTAGRIQENGPHGMEFGYHGKTKIVCDVYEPDCWQYGEYARRINQLTWAWALSDKKRWAELSEYLAAGYHSAATDKANRTYARDLRRIVAKLEPEKSKPQKARASRSRSRQ